MPITYNEMGSESLKKLIRTRKLMNATYTQRIRKEESIAVLEAADRGEAVVIPQRLINIYEKIHTVAPSSTQSTEDNSTDENTAPVLSRKEQEMIDEVKKQKQQQQQSNDMWDDIEEEEEEWEEVDDEVVNQLKSMKQPTTSQVTHHNNDEDTSEDIRSTTTDLYAILDKMREDINTNSQVISINSIATQQLQEIITKHIENHPKGGGGSSLTIKQEDLPEVKLDRVHRDFNLLMRLVSQHINVYMVGPSGSGKREAATQVAKVLFDNDDTKFSAISLCKQTSKGDLLGFRDAHGSYHRSELVRIYEEGGVFLFDEVDQASDSIMKLCNMAIGNDMLPTADGVKKRHERFYVLAAANTYGTGADRLYCGANQLDASTLNRFYFLDWHYDEVLEEQMMGVAKPDGARCELTHTPSAEQWLYVVRKSRENILNNKMRMVVSPRTAVLGRQAINAEATLDEMLHGLIYQGTSQDKQKVVFDPYDGWDNDFQTHAA